MENKFFKALAICIFTFIIIGDPVAGYFATCTGADPCKACKNCKYCKHCAKDGGTCGICKPKPKK